MPSRRALLASVGTVAATALAGCPAFAGTSDPPLDCEPTNLDWPTYGADPARTSHVPSRDLPPENTQPQRFSETGGSPGGGGSTEAPPVVDAGVAYTAGGVRTEARSLATGERLWAVDPEDSVNTSPALGCGAVFVGTLNETVAYDREDGTERWRADAGATAFEGPGSPTVRDDMLYVPGGSVTALDAETGEVRWTASAEQAVKGVAVDDRVYAGLGSNGQGGAAAFTASGDLWWETTDIGPAYACPVVADGRVFVTTKSALVAALDAEDGTVLWQQTLDASMYQPPAAADGTVVVGAGNGARAMAFDAATGERRWSFHTGVSQSAPVVVGDRVLVSGANTGIWALDLATGEERWYSGDLGNVGSQPVVADGALLYRAWNYSDVAVLT